ncbi:MAG: Uma2 family endonuclease [Deltaproteobacteria bacterium]|nr:Uma2 family endonuclease [Deltaproteobacteria bacterium]
MREEQMYPASDGLPMSESTKQYKWIVRFAENLDYLRPDDFVGADNFWYPVEGRPDIRTAPDAYIAFGRPKGHRPSYKQWREEGVAPAVVVEVWSPSNTFADQVYKLQWYERHGVQEFWAWDPERCALTVFVRGGANTLEPVNVAEGWTSPLTGVHMIVRDDELQVTGPDGRPFRAGDEMRVEIAEQEAVLRETQAERTQARREATKFRSQARSARRETEAAQREAEAAQSEAEAAQREAEAAQREAEAAQREAEAARHGEANERDRANALAARLRALGIDPDIA